MLCESCTNEVTPLYCAGGVWYQRCATCGLTQLDSALDDEAVTELYGDSYFTGGGAGYPDYVAEALLLRDHGRWYARILARFTTPGRLLDVGGAAGYVAQGFCDRGWTATVLDPNRRMVSIAASLGEESRVGTLESFDAAETFDLVCMIQVIAHFFDLRKALQAAAAATADRGYLLVETWNSESAIARLLKSRWHEYSPPSVRRIFTPSSLDRVLASHGFYRVAMGRPQKWLLADHARSLLAHKAAQSVALRAVNVIAALVPSAMRIPYPAEDLFWSLYRKALVPGDALNGRQRQHLEVREMQVS